MDRRPGVRRALGAAALVALLATPAAAQFDPQFNHLKCYVIKDQPVQKMLVLDNQFGRERLVNVKLVPQLLCVPTRKSCCGGTPTKANPCPQIIPCQPDPTPAAPLNHFKCYKIGVKTCSDLADPTCATVAGFPKKTVHVSLLDQFGLEPDVIVGPPRYLCAPVVKNIISPTTTTTTIQTTTTTVQNTTTTVVNNTTTTNPTTNTTTTTVPCQNVGPVPGPPMCAGDCPQGSGLQCVFIPSSNQCTCEIPCALQGAACNMQFCPNATQHCQPTAVNPCGCCGLTNSTCVAGSDCCGGTCMNNACQ